MGEKSKCAVHQAIHSVVSRFYNQTKFNCANNQTGANFGNLKLLIVPKTKSALDIIDSTLPLDAAASPRNSPSVKNKTLSLGDYVLTNDFGIVALTETWLGSTIDTTCIGELVPTGYIMKHNPRRGRKVMV